MTARRFVVQKVGDDFVSVPQHRGNGAGGDHPGGAPASLDNAKWWIWGGSLALMGLRKRGLLGLTLLGTGGCMLYHAYTGRNPMAKVNALLSQYGIDLKQICGKVCADSGPSFQHDLKSQSDQAPEDEVDEMVMESFPASDPPASIRPSSRETV